MLKSGNALKIKGPVVIVVTVLLLAAVAGLALVKFSSSKVRFTDSTNPLKVKVKLAKETTSAEISSQGGSLELKGGADKDMSLTLSKGSLFETKQISLTAIESIEGMNKEWKLIAGTQLGPDGTKLAHEGELRIKLPGDLPHKKLMGFAYEADGKDFHYYPIEIKDDTAIFLLNGFSGYGVINVGDSNESPPAPSTTQMQAQQNIAEILRDAQWYMKAGLKDHIDEGHMRDIEDNLRYWYEHSVKVKLAEAEKHPEMVEDAAYEFLSWRQGVHAIGLDDEFKSENEASLNALARATKNAVNKAVEKCVKEKDPSQISKLMHLYTLATMLGLDGRQGLHTEAIKEKAIKLATFELKITDHIHVTIPEVSDDMFHMDADGAGSVPLNLSEDLMLSGNGQFRLGKVRVFTDPDKMGIHANVNNIAEALAYGFAKMLNGEISFDDNYSVSVPPIPLTMSSDAKKVELSLDIQFAGGQDGPMWQEVLKQCHAGEFEGTLFKISGWSVSGKGAVFARKSDSRTKQIEGGNYKEDTTFELLFTPKSQ